MDSTTVRLAALGAGALLAVGPAPAIADASRPPATPSGTADGGADGAGGTRILLSGDSLTQGASGDTTWRYHLWNHLEPDVPGLDFVGPQDEVLAGWPGGGDGDSGYRDPDFDTHHDSSWGRTLQEASLDIGDLVAEYQPDVVVALYGVNDQAFGAEPHEYARYLERFIGAARDAQPGVDIVLSTVPPTTFTSTGDQAAILAAFDREVGEVAAEQSTEASRIAVADIAGDGGYDAEADTYDGTHPNANGEKRIAAAVADTLAGELSLGSPYTGPAPGALPDDPEEAAPAPRWPLLVTAGLALAGTAALITAAARRSRSRRADRP
ncbi:GDSL-type esterase/lipase family protein [Nocardiopsis coralliicola]